jgi:AcrR family transcriptional regulator
MLDEGGHEALSMTRVAERLGVTTMALYRHVKDRRDLEAGVVELAFTDVMMDNSAVADWRVGVERWMWSIRSHWLRHPWIESLLRTGDHVSPGGFAVMDRLARLLEQTALDEAERARAVVWVARIAVGLVSLELQAPTHVGHRPDTLLQMMDSDQLERWTGLMPAIVGFSNDDVFDTAVRMTVATLSQRSAEAETRTR